MCAAATRSVVSLKELDATDRVGYRVNSTRYNVLVLCTGNSARSILAEALFNTLGQGRIKAFSAGSKPVGRVHPMALELLSEQGYPIETLRSKSWHEFAESVAEKMDFIFTVCDRARGEPCPVWPGKPISGHWGFDDPAAVLGSDAHIRAAFERTYREVGNRIRLFLSLPLEQLDYLSLQRHISAIGASSSLFPR
jgi:arsenate reductase (thioredoxin)